MDAIGNNVVNTNTYGFKSSRTTFRDMYYQIISSSTSASGARSGNNASQIDYGVSIVSADVLNTRISYATTGNSMDLYTDGESYFVMRDGNGNEHLTQVGTLDFDGGGDLTDGSGNSVRGYLVDKLKSMVSVGGVKADLDFVSSIGSTKDGSYTIGGEDTSCTEGYTFKVVDGGVFATEGVELDPIQKTITATLWTTGMTRKKLQSML